MVLPDSKHVARVPKRNRKASVCLLTACLVRSVPSEYERKPLIEHGTGVANFSVLTWMGRPGCETKEVEYGEIETSNRTLQKSCSR
jgi:hypothetical protein